MSSPQVPSLREELLAVLKTSPVPPEFPLNTAVLSSFRFQGREIRFSSQNYDFVLYLQEILREVYKLDFAIAQAKTRSVLSYSGLSVSRALRSELEQFASSAWSSYFDNRDEAEIAAYRRALLSTLFLACGSLASPQESYQLEFALQRPLAWSFFEDYLLQLDLPVRRLKHQGYYILYLKDGQSISDFLLYAGAHQYMLRFEAMRVQKDMVNQVNRVVNCDSANAQRVADSSARQRQAIIKLQENGSFRNLNPGLQAAGNLRLRYPELSLSELGEMMDPPLGKSGMNYRLKKLIGLAEEL